MNISLPESMKDWVDQQVATGGYGTISEFFRHLIRESQKRQKREEIDVKLLQALESGEPVMVDPKYWEEKRRRLTKLTQQNKDR